MEIQLRLDENGRTTYDPTTTTVKYDDSTTTTTTKEKEQNNSDKKCNDNIDYGTKSLKTSFYDHSDDDDKNNILNSILDDILLDCEVNILFERKNIEQFQYRFGYNGVF